MGGTVLVAGGIGWLSGITEHSGYLSGVLGAMIVFSLGLGLIFVSTTISGVAGVDRRQSGLASALLNVGQQLGASVGLAVLGTVAVNTTRNHLLLARPSHLAFVHAITTGYDAALMISALIGAGAFLLAVLFVRREKSGTTMDTVPDAA
jgi:hypothetical protein